MTTTINMSLKISAGSYLYRAAKTVEQHPTPYECKDTGKTGIYFAFENPYLSEMMCVEYGKDLWVAKYEVVEDIENLSYGKYGFTNGYSGRYSKPWKYVPPEDNLSHVDFDIYPVINDGGEYRDEPDGHVEVFLTEKDLMKVKLVDYYRMTLDECRRKWGVNDM